MNIGRTIWIWRWTLIRTVIYTIGHIIIAAIVNILITGAPLDLATLDALVEPIINGFWYFGLEWFWRTYIKK
jgi:uncharacterized membrane protein